MTRPLSPIERMIDAACGVAPGKPPPTRRGYNFRRVVIACPLCGRSKETHSLRSDPPAAARVVFPCADHADHGWLEPQYFDADGQELDPETGDPIQPVSPKE